jgi:excisionase family DNA binding protein
MHADAPPPQASGTPAAPAANDSAWLDTDAASLLGRRITGWLAMHDVQSRALARAMGTSPTILSRTLHGWKPFPRDLARRLCQHTGLDPHGDAITYDPARAATGKPPPRRADGEPAYTSGQVARMLGISASTVVNYEAQGKLTSTRTKGGHRRYPHSQVAALLPPGPDTPQSPRVAALVPGTTTRDHHPPRRPPVPSTIPEDTRRRWDASGNKSQCAALLIGQWAHGQPPGTIIPADDVLITRYPKVYDCYGMPSASNPATIHRAIRLLADMQILHRDPGTGHYHVAPAPPPGHRA